VYVNTALLELLELRATSWRAMLTHHGASALCIYADALQIMVDDNEYIDIPILLKYPNCSCTCVSTAIYHLKTWLTDWRQHKLTDYHAALATRLLGAVEKCTLRFGEMRFFCVKEDDTEIKSYTYDYPTVVTAIVRARHQHLDIR
jgi:hypothetical protein